MDGSFDPKEKKEKMESFQNASRKSPPPLPSAALKKNKKRPFSEEPKPI
jgi:hypothetical protein